MNNLASLANEHWMEVKPLQLSNKYKHNSWMFIVFYDFKSKYEVLLFRNKGRSNFGIKEFKKAIHYRNIRKLVTKIATNEQFRESLLSDNPDLPKIWKKR